MSLVDPVPERVEPPPAIDHATASDIDALATLMAAAPLQQRYGVTREAALAALRTGLAEGDTLLVARAGGEVTGLAWLVFTRAFNQAAYLRLLLVAPGRQRAGLGTALLHAAETAARVGANHLYMHVTADNADARRFYERHGYRHLADRPGYVLPHLDEALYTRTLRDHGERLGG